MTAYNMTAYILPFMVDAASFLLGLAFGSVFALVFVLMIMLLRSL
jgi:hypothetical protein